MTVFQRNLMHLVQLHHRGNVSRAAIALDINRTQLNRYLFDGTWPQEAPLRRICDHFQVDARILLEPLSGVTS